MHPPFPSFLMTAKRNFYWTPAQAGVYCEQQFALRRRFVTTFHALPRAQLTMTTGNANVPSLLEQQSLIRIWDTAFLQEPSRDEAI
jgi:hypothetical protein